MIQQLSNGKYRARYDYGHNKFYRHLLKIKRATEKKITTLRMKLESKQSDTKEIKSLLNDLASTNYDIQILESEYGKPVDIKTRRSFISRHLWQAENAEQFFLEAYEYEAEGYELPKALQKTIDNLHEAP